MNRKIKQSIMAIIYILVLALIWVYPILGPIVLICMFGGVILSAFKGRKWCNWYCPRGSFADIVFSQISPGKKIPDFFKSIKFRLIVLLFFMGVLFYRLYSVFPNYSSTAKIFVFMLTGTTILALILALFINQRAWCSICPAGTMMNLISRGKADIVLDSEKCVLCKKCEQACPLQLKPYEVKAEGLVDFNNPDCIRCGLCINVCPTKALKRKNL